MFDKLHEECGIFTIYGSSDAAVNTALGLHALQHRGQEAAGIVSMSGENFSAHFAEGLVADNFTSKRVIKKLEGNSAIGHVRYSTAGKKTARNSQPIYAELSLGFLALAHNGNLTNAVILRKKLINQGAIFQSTMDTEIIIHLIALSQKATLNEKIIDAVSQIEGAFSLVIIHKDGIIALRDPHGVRPLVLGKLGDAYVVASETCALDIIGAKFERDIVNGEMVNISKDGIKSQKPFAKKPSKFCIFEYVYFARPDSIIEGKHVYEMRKNIGIELAREIGIDADVIVPVPDSGVPSAIGYAMESKIPFELGIIRNHYVGRTFIEPTDRIRHFGVKLKHNANLSVIKGKRVILIDDSIVRGTTSKKIVQMIRDAGAKEVHMLIASPPTIAPCFYGVDTPDKKDLIASQMSVEEIRKIIGADRLDYISIDGLYRAITNSKRNEKNPQYCDACFSDNYPIRLTDKVGEAIPLFGI
ncbi:MAG: amidophosphoribosyltransferase [Alphaproteobacteria bacterium RIFCSPLOWO2_01_FULL_40_26]|nr:MAG: amidophosphoribosyltransferase [Alphaproteobacteria bacterium RIFCSPHIGHO2_02_FULL_40_34]OFW95130.1 MAG: amidophosphoribosyltransferase [Alphaproteobacteria bacterium RIFCSPLOWO2_01_FULL_40_26]OFX09146.1 MAG: amidophosphoribosyltransferase [Alphaproteobacteria bacterium RIFCSPLOWO2_02_FULL_40_19]OFX12190.1 MAG: amidophosphoribosyltransferase [Alphaproteobacteria bacterium RIFCSPLOWO2_12_FULL_40_11]